MKSFDELYLDIERLPEGQRGEVLAPGELHVLKGRPGKAHRRLVQRLLHALRDVDEAFAPGGGWWLEREAEVRFGDRLFVPDIAGWRVDRVRDLPDNPIPIVPDWVCEVISPWSGGDAPDLKLPVYAKQGVPHVWLVDPYARLVRVYAPTDGKQTLTASASKEDARRLPPFHLELPHATKDRSTVATDRSANPHGAPCRVRRRLRTEAMLPNPPQPSRSMVYVEAKNLPSHIGIIMDGNGRWAQLRGGERVDGHREGSKAVRRIVRCARRLGIKALTLYAFSEQNWARPDLEVDALMMLLREFLLSERDEILDNGIRLNAIGNLGRLPALVRGVLEPLRNESAGSNEMTLTLALSYGGREEIATAARELARDVASGKIAAEGVTEEALHARMPSLTVGDPDLVIRTGGERRISNFLLYGLAYAELHFADVLWPDFTENDLYDAIASYQSRERRFGLVGKGVEPVLAPPPAPPLPPLRLVG